MIVAAVAESVKFAGRRNKQVDVLDATMEALLDTRCRRSQPM